ncbi:MAG: hypothetical protein Q8M16_08110 [Pirellulaceae bacterium]|nr:hypothetical protein [Pirellulaceae bacterium]
MCYLPWCLFFCLFCNVGDDSPFTDALRADRLLPKDTILLIEADSVGRVFQVISSTAEHAELSVRDRATSHAVEGVYLRPNRFAFSGLDNPIPTVNEYHGAWPFQLYGSDAADFRLDRVFFQRFFELTKQDWQLESGFYSEVLNGPGFIALVKLKGGDYSYVFRIKLDAPKSLERLLAAEQVRLGGESVESAASPGTVINNIASSGLRWFIFEGYLYVSGCDQLAESLIGRLAGNGDADDCLARNRLYQRLKVHSANSRADLKLYIDALQIAKYRNTWWLRHYLPDQLPYVGEVSRIPQLGLLLHANFEADYAIDVSATEVWSAPSEEPIFTSLDLPSGYQIPLEIPEDADGMVVFGEHPLGRGMEPEYQWHTINDKYPPFSGVCFYKSSEEIRYRAFSWKHRSTPSKFDPDFEGNNLLESFSLDDNDTDTVLDESRLNNREVADPGFSFFRHNDDWYYIDPDYEIRTALKTKIMNRAGDNNRNFDNEFINSRLNSARERMPFLVEAGRVPSSSPFFLPVPPSGAWKELLGLPPSDDFYQFGTPFDERHFQYSGLLMTKDELLVNQKAESLDWLSDFWFRVRFNCLPYFESIRAQNPPIIYSFNYLDRPAGILHKEIRIEFRKPD